MRYLMKEEYKTKLMGKICRVYPDEAVENRSKILDWAVFCLESFYNSAIDRRKRVSVMLPHKYVVIDANNRWFERRDR